MFNRYGDFPARGVYDLRNRVVYRGNPPPSPAFSSASSASDSPRREWKPDPSPSPVSSYTSSSSVASSPGRRYISSSSDEEFFLGRQRRIQPPHSPAHSWTSDNSIGRAPTPFLFNQNLNEGPANVVAPSLQGVRRGSQVPLQEQQMAQCPTVFQDPTYTQFPTEASTNFRDIGGDWVSCKYCNKVMKLQTAQYSEHLQKCPLA